MAQCKGCGRSIRWIETKSGSRMPCDVPGVPYWRDMNGKKRIVTQEGDVVSCELEGESGKVTGIGFIPHWATCKNRQRFRRKKTDDGIEQGSLF